MFCSIYILILLQFTNGEIIASNDTVLMQQYKDHETVLCRRCGGEITTSKAIISITSPFSHRSSYESLFDLDNVLVQQLLSDYFFYYPVITTTQSTCVGVGEWEEKDSWFPGYQWKPCICPDCGELIGWIFHHTDSDSVAQVDELFALIVTDLIGQSFVQSLLVYPTESEL